MKYGIHTLDDYDVRGKTVIMRIDINQPVDRAGGRLKDTTRIEASVPTIAELSDRGARLVLLAHQGSDIEYENFASLDLHGGVLRGLLGRDVRFVDDVCGPAARAAIFSSEGTAASSPDRIPSRTLSSAARTASVRSLSATSPQARRT